MNLALIYLVNNYLLNTFKMLATQQTKTQKILSPHSKMKEFKSKMEGKRKVKWGKVKNQDNQVTFAMCFLECVKEKNKAGNREKGKEVQLLKESWEFQVEWLGKVVLGELVNH